MSWRQGAEDVAQGWQVTTVEQVQRAQQHYKYIQDKQYWTKADGQESLYDPSKQVTDSIGKIKESEDQHVLKKRTVSKLRRRFQ